MITTRFDVKVRAGREGDRVVLSAVGPDGSEARITLGLGGALRLAAEVLAECHELTKESPICSTAR